MILTIDRLTQTGPSQLVLTIGPLAVYNEKAEAICQTRQLAHLVQRLLVAELPDPDLSDSRPQGEVAINVDAAVEILESGEIGSLAEISRLRVSDGTDLLAELAFGLSAPDGRLIEMEKPASDDQTAVAGQVISTLEVFRRINDMIGIAARL